VSPHAEDGALHTLPQEDMQLMAAAVGLFIMAQELLPRASAWGLAGADPPPAAAAAAAAAAVPHHIVAAVEVVVQAQPGCMQLGGRLGGWVLSHCQQVPR